MHSVPFTTLAYKFILMLVECINFEVTPQLTRFSKLGTTFAGQWAGCATARGPSGNR